MYTYIRRGKLNTKKLRKVLKMSQSKFAKAINYSLSTITKWDQGYFHPSPQALKAIKKLCEEKGINIYKESLNLFSAYDL